LHFLGCVGEGAYGMVFHGKLNDFTCKRKVFERNNDDVAVTSSLLLMGLDTMGFIW